jgi:periplasmic protein TonB
MVFGASNVANDTEDRPRLQVTKSVAPLLPLRAIQVGVVEGDCRITVSVDSDGKLVDYLVIAYTHPSLADATVAAIKQWEFAPPRWHGEPISIQRDIEVHFENRGSVVSMDVASFLDTYLTTLFPDRFSYRPRTLKEIDRIPTPIHAERPLVPKNAKGEITVQFFIDETGSVRMPSLLHTEDQALGTAAIAAVQQWKFEPPTVGGKPVLVRAQQTFRFQP